MKLIASLAPARAEIEAGVVAKAGQFPIINLVWYSTDFKREQLLREMIQIQDLTNFGPTDISTSTAAKQKDDEASKLLLLINIIRDEKTKEREGRKGKSSNLFGLLPETENKVEGNYEND